jgi:hypothetical protein
MKETLYNLALTWEELGSGNQALELLREVISLDEQFDYPTLSRDTQALINFSEKYKGHADENS